MKLAFSSVLSLNLVLSVLAWTTNDVYTRTCRHGSDTSAVTSTSLFQQYYSKGAEIFPPCNQKRFTLADSFPNGAIPPMAQNILREKRVEDASKSMLEENSSLTSRRNILLAASSAAVVAAAAQYAQNPAVKNQQLSTPFAKAMGISDAIQWIDTFCDRRFLHAVISSDYKFIYRGISNNGRGYKASIHLESPTPDLLSLNTYNDPQALNFFEDLEKILDAESVKPSVGHLATSSSRDAAQWGEAASIWPIKGAHYAWFQDCGLFYPRSSSSSSFSRDDLIIDGKDCGKESLEDALLSESGEVLIATDSFLVVPSAFDEELREMLRGSFLV